MNTPSSYGKKKEYIKISEHMMRLFSIGRGQLRGRIADKEAAREVAKKYAERDETERYFPISLSTHSSSTKEDTKEPIEKKRRDKAKVLKKRNDAKKRQNLEANKAKATEENEAREKADVEAKVVSKKEKELFEATRVVTELVEKEAVDKAAKEEKRRNMQMIERVTHTQWTWMSLEHPPHVQEQKQQAAVWFSGLGNLFGLLKYWTSTVSHTIEKLVVSYKKGLKKF
jgi:hypothetical protein